MYIIWLTKKIALEAGHKVKKKTAFIMHNGYTKTSEELYS